MRKLIVLAFALAGCGGNPQVTVNGKILQIADTIFETMPNGYFCNGLFMNQVMVQMGDYKPFCSLDQTPDNDPRDPTIGHYELDLVMSLGAQPNYKLMPFTINPNTDCDTGGGPALANFLHFPANPNNQNPQPPDSTVTARGGTIKITSYDSTDATKPMTGTYDLDFGDPHHVTGSFSAENCDPNH